MVGAVVVIAADYASICHSDTIQLSTDNLCWQDELFRPKINKLIEGKIIADPYGSYFRADDILCPTWIR
jgi:hypothetical protein